MNGDRYMLDGGLQIYLSEEDLGDGNLFDFFGFMGRVQRELRRIY